jgi:hypothetical protein
MPACHRELFSNLFRRDFQAKYKGSLLGVLYWSLNPLILLGVYLLVFGVIFPSPQTPHYALYLAGLLIFFATSMQSAARSLVIRPTWSRRCDSAPARRVRMVATRTVLRGDRDPDQKLADLHPRRSTVARHSLALKCRGCGLARRRVSVVFRDEHVLAAALLPWFFVADLWSAQTSATGLPATTRCSACCTG